MRPERQPNERRPPAPSQTCMKGA
ncbi:MAG: hypothetical protein QOE10_749, partial [Gaiellales bacterium]|nr:hypothetical protein [Gaiellales bacterium]